MQIRQMEDQAGLPLFRHTGKRISLTEAGMLILRHCQVILADLKTAEQSLADLMTGGIQRLRVGLITSGSYFFPHLINAFMQRNARVDLDMTVRSRDQLITLLRSDEIDLAVMVHAPDGPAIVAEPFAPNPFVLVAAPTHALAYENDIPYARIALECLIVRESGTDTRNAANDTFRGRESTPRFMEIGCEEAIKQSVMAGMGISFLSAQAVQSEVRAGLLKVLDVQGFPLKRHWCVAHRVDRPLPPVARDFRQFLLTEAGTRLEHFTGIERVHTGMDLQRPDHTALETKAIAASSASHEVALRTRALLRGDALPDEHRVQSQDHAGGDDRGADQLPARSKSTHH
ncbi:DNA-binding transcriptional regulator, LysR family [Paraburkholderia susongensis]|uniref:DNA-binding transcriptional regulator, LysR family n=2 Tax=Paraburkholderia susongensis TaxID=1515439 RepID=A0A1X7L5J7_9BURK|nr:DNA-binding transcriptional regulator, LysR family [Paraburkholderia susongensis]